MNIGLTASILLVSDTRQKHGTITNPFLQGQVWIISLKSVYNFWGNLGALRTGFIQARAPTEKLPKVAHRRKEEQGGEELEPYPLSFPEA